MIQHLIYLNMMDEAENIRNVTREYIDAVSGYQPKSFAQVRFEELHLEASELYAGEQK